MNMNNTHYEYRVIWEMDNGNEILFSKSNNIQAICEYYVQLIYEFCKNNVNFVDKINMSIYGINLIEKINYNLNDKQFYYSFLLYNNNGIYFTNDNVGKAIHHLNNLLHCLSNNNYNENINNYEPFTNSQNNVMKQEKVNINNDKTVSDVNKNLVLVKNRKGGGKVYKRKNNEENEKKVLNDVVVNDEYKSNLIEVKKESEKLLKYKKHELKKYEEKYKDELNQLEKKRFREKENKEKMEELKRTFKDDIPIYYDIKTEIDNGNLKCPPSIFELKYKIFNDMYECGILNTRNFKEYSKFHGAMELRKILLICEGHEDNNFSLLDMMLTDELFDDDDEYNKLLKEYKNDDNENNDNNDDGNIEIINGNRKPVYEF